MKLIDSQAKFLALIFMIIMGYGSLGDLAVYTVKIPSLNDLEITKGKVVIGRPDRHGRQFILDTGSAYLKFSCSLGTKDKTCVDKKIESNYVGKLGTAWWYKANILPFVNVKRLVQLKVDNQLVIAYEAQRKKYLGIRDTHFCLATILFLIALIVFIRLQFFKNFIIKRNKL